MILKFEVLMMILDGGGGDDDEKYTETKKWHHWHLLPPIGSHPTSSCPPQLNIKNCRKKTRVTPSGEHQQKTNYKLTRSNTDLICWSAAFFQFYSFLHCGVIFLCWFFFWLLKCYVAFCCSGWFVCLLADLLTHSYLLCSRFGFSFTACVACVLRSSSSSSYSTLCVFWRELKCLSARRLRACVRV